MLRTAIHNTLGARCTNIDDQQKLINQLLDGGRCPLAFMGLDSPERRGTFYSQFSEEIDKLVEEDEELILLTRKSADTLQRTKIRVAVEKVLILIEQGLKNGTS